MARFDLTPGVLDGAARHAFTMGACAALALALHKRTGWPLVAITDHHNASRPEGGGLPQAGWGSSLHYGVLHPSGKFVDVDGAQDVEEATRAYDGDADDGRAAWGITSEAIVREWYVNCQGEPVPVRVAESFVDAVLKQLETKA